MAHPKYISELIIKKAFGLPLKHTAQQDAIGRLGSNQYVRLTADNLFEMERPE